MGLGGGKGGLRLIHRDSRSPQFCSVRCGFMGEVFGSQTKNKEPKLFLFAAHCTTLALHMKFSGSYVVYTYILRKHQSISIYLSYTKPQDLIVYS